MLGERHLRSPTRLLVVAVCALLIANAVWPSRSQAQEGTTPVPSSIDELFTIFGVGDVPADFVVVVDTSGSMSQGPNPPYPAVLESYRSLVDAIPDGDNLSVLTFDSSPNVSFEGGVDPSSREAAKAALPPVPDGDATDIGAALDAALRRLERADASDVQLVIFLTDGAHQPAAGTAFPTTAGPEWDALRVRADAVAQRNDTLVLGIGLGDQGAGGIELLRQVFGNPEINSLPPDQLPAFFQESVRRSQLARLKTLVDDELTNGVDVVSSGTATLDDTMDVEVEIRSSLEKLPVDVRIDGVTSAERDGQPMKAELIGDDSIRIPPGGSATVTVRLEPEVAEPGFEVPPVTESKTIDVGLDATYQVLPADLLARVTSTSTTGAVEGRHVVDASRTYGRTVAEILTFLAAAAAALLLLLWLYKQFLQLPKLVGVFVIENPPDETKAVIRLTGKRQRITGKDVPKAGAAKIDLFTRRGKPKRVYAKVETPPFAEVEGRRERLVADEAEIRVNKYRLGGGMMKYRPKPPERDRGSSQ